ncbi:MAG: hypothetical protein GX115_00870 [Ruminiclostridium sp.]|nr:hypothetical protein [Ruminiclostridium sp.]
MNNTLFIELSDYNKKVFPAQIVMFLVGTATSLFLFLSPGKLSLTISLFSIVLFYLWIGVTYPFLFRALLKRSRLMILLVAVSLMLAVFLTVDILSLKDHESLMIRSDSLRTYCSIGLIIWGLLLHPVAGVILRGYKSTAYVGVYTCPTAPYAIGVLSMIHLNQLGTVIFIVISCIAVVTGITAGLYGMKKEHVYEDIALIPIGLYGLLSMLTM